MKKDISKKNISYLFPKDSKCDFFSIDISFICLSYKYLKNLEKILKKYQISTNHILNSNYDYLQEIAQACDLCVKPWRHSIINTSTEQALKSNDDYIDLTLRVESRDRDGERFPENDLEIEIYRSGHDLSITLTWLFFPDRPILWHGKHRKTLIEEL